MCGPESCWDSVPLSSFRRVWLCAPHRNADVCTHARCRSRAHSRTHTHVSLDGCCAGACYTCTNAAGNCLSTCAAVPSVCAGKRRYGREGPGFILCAAGRTSGSRTTLNGPHSLRLYIAIAALDHAVTHARTCIHIVTSRRSCLHC